MSKARNLANLLNSAGEVEVGNIADGTITAAKQTIQLVGKNKKKTSNFRYKYR